MDALIKKEWFKDLDISPKGQPQGIEQIEGALPAGTCYCIVSNNENAWCIHSQGSFI